VDEKPAHDGRTLGDGPKPAHVVVAQATGPTCPFAARTMAGSMATYYPSEPSSYFWVQ